MIKVYQRAACLVARLLEAKARVVELEHLVLIFGQDDTETFRHSIAF